MATFLENILEHKRKEVEQAARRISENELRRRAENRMDLRPFFSTLLVPKNGDANVIAEIKRASPSRGPIRPDLDPAELAVRYEAGGASALSVLCDVRFFGAHPNDLAEARKVVSLPVLRKDFIISTYQIHETVAMGADAVLLIVRALDPGFLRDAIELCGGLGLAALVEVHDDGEMERAIKAGARLIGINNRNLDTFGVDLATTERLATQLGPAHIAVAESGIGGREDVKRLVAAGIHNFLVGESLVRSDDPAAALQGFMRD
ncbi:MAG: indole-3-glycerol phosphate synthase TrpC [Desulfatibacillaceae bacterium]